MGLRVTELELADFRSFGRLSVRLADAVTVFVGPNAAGKTNTVEALQLLTAGQSFRRPTPSQLVRDGAASARADAAPSRTSCDGVGRLNDWPAVSSCSASTVLVLPAALGPTKTVTASASRTERRPKLRKSASSSSVTRSPTPRPLVLLAAARA